MRNENDGYAIVQNSVLMNRKLSWKAKGVLAYLIGRPPGWTYNVADVVNQSLDGEAATRSALAELRVAGYLTEPIPVKGLVGKVVNWQWGLTPLATACRPGATKPVEASETLGKVKSAQPKPDAPKGKPEALPLLLESEHPQVPVSLKTPGFIEAWEEWTKYRKAGRRPTGGFPRLFAVQLRTLEPYGADLAIAAIRRSLDNGWTGLFPESIRHNQHRGKHQPQPQPNYTENGF